MPISTIGSNSLNQTSDLTINGQTVGKGGGNVATNTAHGVSALASNSTGANATAVGYQAGYTNAGGLRVSFFGSQAGYYMTDENTSVGYRALYGASGSTGYYNVAVGRYALNVLTSGTSNVAIGDNALQANTTGIENTAVGYQALNANLTASYNTSVGRNSLYLTTTGTHNTCIGHNSGYNISTGTKNTILGRYDGNQGGLNITTSSNNIVLSDGDGTPQMYYSSSAVSWYAQKFYDSTAALSANLAVASNGQIVRATSSIKYKKDVQDATHGLTDLLKLRSVTYKGRNENVDKEIVYGGLIAEEVHEAGLTEFVQYADDGTPDALAYGNMVSLLVKSIQELKALVDAQATEIAELKAKVAP